MKTRFSFFLFLCCFCSGNGLLFLSAQIVEVGIESEPPELEVISTPSTEMAVPAVEVEAFNPEVDSEGGIIEGEVVEEAEGAGSTVTDAINVSSARRVMYEAMVDVQDEKYDEAIPKLEWVLEEDPTLLGAWETLGWAYWLTDRQEDAVELWTRLVDIAPEEPMGYNLMGQVATRNGDFGKAYDYYSKSLELNPSQFEIRVSLAQVLLWGGDREAAIENFTQLFEEDPERTDIQIDLAWSLYGNEQYEESLYHWNQIIDAIPGHAGFLIARANVHLLMGMLSEAEQDAYAALEVEPENLAALNILIALSIQNNRPRETVARLRVLQDRVEGRENQIRVAQRIAVFMNAVHNENPGIFSQEQVVQAGKDVWDLDRGNVGSALFYGEALVSGKEFEAAANVFEYVIENLNRYNERARYGLLETYLGRGMNDEAEQQLVDNLRNFNPENPFRFVYWARIHFARGDFPLAMKALDRLEREGARGAVFTLLYKGISPSEFSDLPSVRQLREQVMALRRDGFTFMTVSELPAYFDSKSEPPPAELDRPWLNRMVESVKYSWTAEEPEHEKILRDYTPEKRVIITFDGGLRNSFRYGTMVAEEIETTFTMFVGVGDAITRMKRYVANFPEILEYYHTGRWEIQSHLWDGTELSPIEEEGPVLYLPLPNRIWIEEKDRMETLNEYQNRLRKEFAESRNVLARELDIPIKKIMSVSYPSGDIGQDSTTNIELFDVINVILNEAEIAYDQGFLQNRFGYAMKGDNPLLYKRFEPHRHASGRYVLRQAYLQHPVYVARRMRAEIAALNGLYDMAMENVELLRRDGYPEEDLRELTKFVDRNLSVLIPAPSGIEDTATGENNQALSSFLKIEKPYIGVDGRTVRSNEIIDEEELGVFAGVNLNRRMAFQARYAEGQIEQNLNSPTNRVFETFTSRTGSTRRTFTEVINGQTVRVSENTTFTDSSSFQSNIVEQIEYKADYERVDGLLSYIHDSGSFTIVRGGVFKLERDQDGTFFRQDNEFVYSIEHQWRPFPSMDFSALYNHGVVPSAVELITYDQLLFRPIWRVTDHWQASGLASFSFYEDNNSFVNGELENIWLISENYNVWAGLFSSITTTDEPSDLYWTPYWEQRHYALMQIRRNYAGFSASLQGNLGFQKEKARDEEIQEYLNLQAAAAEQGGFSAGEGPDEGWNKLMGFSASLNKTFANGFEVNASFLVNATKAYIEHNVFGSILYRF